MIAACSAKAAKKRRRKNLGYQLVPIDPSWQMIMALAGEPMILAASIEEELRRRYGSDAEGVASQMNLR